MRSIAELIKACGGAKVIAHALKRPDHSFVQKWHRNGIPDRCWPVVMRLSGATTDELFNANSTVSRYGPVKTERGAA